MNDLKDFVTTISGSLDKKPYDRYFLDELQALVTNKEFVNDRVNEPYYSLNEETLVDEKVIFKSFFFSPEKNKTFSISRSKAFDELAEGIFIITTKRIVIHFRKVNDDVNRTDLEADLASISVTVDKSGSERKENYVMHSYHNSLKDPYLIIRSGDREIKLLLLIFLDSNSSPYVQNKNRGFAGIVHYCAILRLIKRLLKFDPNYISELQIYYDHKYSVNPPSTTSCVIVLLMFLIFPLIFLSLFFSQLLQNSTLSLVAIIAFIILFLWALIYAITHKSTITPQMIDPSLLRESV